jgi:hypothetical protein
MINGMANGMNNGMSNGRYQGGQQGRPADPEGSWECISCSNVNWPKRTSCNRCKIAKPISSADAATDEACAGGASIESTEGA